MIKQLSFRRVFTQESILESLYYLSLTDTHRGTILELELVISSNIYVDFINKRKLQQIKMRILWLK